MTSDGWEPDALTAHFRIYEEANSIVHGSNIVTPSGKPVANRENKSYPKRKRVRPTHPKRRSRTVLKWKIDCRRPVTAGVILLTSMRAELYWITDAPHGRLATMPRPRAGDWLAGELTSMKSLGVDAVVSLLTDDEITDLDLRHEPALCQDIGLTFISHPIADRDVPTSVDNFLAFTNQLHEYLCDDFGVAIHCRMGIGRSSLVAACLLVKSGMSVTDAFASISRDRGIDVPDTNDQIEWVQSITSRLQIQNGTTAK